MPVRRPLLPALPLSLLVLALVPVSLPGQTAAPTLPPAGAADSATPAPSFIRADVHPSPWITYRYMNGGTLRGDRYTLHQATMLDMIVKAYSLDPTMVQGGPSWLEFDRFDIVAQAPPGTPAAMLKLMLRSLLTERFGLVTHKGMAPMPTWVLTAVKPKFVEAHDGATECVPQPPPGGSTTMFAAACHSMPMDEFAPILEGLGGSYLDHKPVVDSTGLPGKYDFEFHWTPSGLGHAGPNGISIFDAMEKQLGLKLDLKTSPRPALIVDQVSRNPTPNAPGIEKDLPPEPPAQFEVAVIKPSKPGDESLIGLGGEGLFAQANSPKELIQEAWNLNSDDDEDLVGLPPWGASDRYDIRAKASAEVFVPSLFSRREVERELAREMLRALLIERFGIQAHVEERPVTAYNFEAAGPKLQLADPAERTKCSEGPSLGRRDPRTPALDRLVHCQNITLTEFGSELATFAPDYIDTPVLDDTGLQGRYDFTLSFSDADWAESGSGDTPSAGASAVPSDPSGGLSLYDALRHQLGLRLEKVRRPGPVLVIDQINREPSAN